jgi:hypothetical protein
MTLVLELVGYMDSRTISELAMSPQLSTVAAEPEI